jgi:GT2 family glycosyltransferase
MTSPLITIGLTTYNAEDTVKRALESIFRQTWRPFEVVVVDDCSSDNTLEIVNNYAHIHPEMRVFQTEKNGGISVSSNRIINEARGEFLAFFDDDDESLPERIAEQYRRITEYERDFACGAPVVCHTARKVIYPNGETRIQSTLGETEGIPAPSGHAVSKYILMGVPLKAGGGACPTCCLMARVATFRDLGGYDPAFRRVMDTDFIVVLAEAGVHFTGIARPLVIQTMTPSSDKSIDIEYENTMLMLKKHCHIMEDAGQYDFCSKWMNLKFAWLKRQRIIFGLNFLSLLITYPILTTLRLLRALPNIGINKSFRRFHVRQEDIRPCRN